MIDTPVSRYYRIIQEELATEADFEPYAAQGRPAPSDPYLRRLWQGISVYDSLERAMSQARKRPSLGAYVAELEIPWGRNIQAERTGHRRGHHTLWGEPKALLACVVRVVPVLR